LCHARRAGVKFRQGLPDWPRNSCRGAAAQSEMLTRDQPASWRICRSHRRSQLLAGFARQASASVEVSELPESFFLSRPLTITHVSQPQPLVGPRAPGHKMLWCARQNSVQTIQFTSPVGGVRPRSGSRSLEIDYARAAVVVSRFLRRTQFGSNTQSHPFVGVIFVIFQFGHDSELQSVNTVTESSCVAYATRPIGKKRNVPVISSCGRISVGCRGLRRKYSHTELECG